MWLLSVEEKTKEPLSNENINNFWRKKKGLNIILFAQLHEAAFIALNPSEAEQHGLLGFEIAFHHAAEGKALLRKLCFHEHEIFLLFLERKGRSLRGFAAELGGKITDLHLGDFLHGGFHEQLGAELLPLLLVFRASGLGLVSRVKREEQKHDP